MNSPFLFLSVDCEEHWTNGGTAVTNFHATDRPIYQIAIARYKGLHKLWIENIPMPPLKPDGEHNCLHCSFAAEEKDLTDFWKLMEQIKKESKQ